MLRIILLIVITYIVIRIALRLLLTESPAQKRFNRRANYRSPHGRSYPGGDHHGFGRGSSGSEKASQPASMRFKDVEDAEFEEIPDESRKSKKS